MSSSCLSLCHHGRFNSVSYLQICNQWHLQPSDPVDVDAIIASSVRDILTYVPQIIYNFNVILIVATSLSLQQGHAVVAVIKEEFSS